MKILVACVDMVPQNTGRQPWFYMHSVASGLRMMGHDVRVLTDEETCDERDIVLKDFRSFPHGINARLNTLISRNGSDAVVWSTGLSDLFFRNSIGVLKIPVISVMTSPRYSLRELMALGRDLALNREFVKQFFLGPLISERRMKKFLAIPNLKAVVFQCRETFRRYIPFDAQDDTKTFVVPPPLPGDLKKNIQQACSGQKPSSGRKFRILYFGPPISLRGIDTLINAFSEVSRSVNGVMLDILSRTEHAGLLRHEQRIRRLINEKGLADKVNIISGVLSPDEIIIHIRSSDLVCLPFKFVVSDVPLVILETLAAGTPLITTNVAGVEEFARNMRCDIIPPRNTRALADAIMRAVSGHKRQKQDGTAKDLFEKHDLLKFGESFDSILKAVI